MIKRYNNADSYALAVGHLADRIRGGGEFSVDWPDADLRLSDTELMQVQTLLADRGLYEGEIDGNIGSGSRAAIMSYQETVGVAADGQVSQKLLEMLQAGNRPRGHRVIFPPERRARLRVRWPARRFPFSPACPR